MNPENIRCGNQKWNLTMQLISARAVNKQRESNKLKKKKSEIGEDNSISSLTPSSTLPPPQKKGWGGKKTKTRTGAVVCKEEQAMPVWWENLWKRPISRTWCHMCLLQEKKSF
ncbi:hypothetical protein KIL84_006308 [Mauremys mutica]|uniref:Uncharacterized protein n=1 Tax=Mauremys mutica TaxID=74926 RepID=A0A9D3X171_9SAUR|nr:hypothetical protein KIL84_006308 [Mauremys mutica]